MGLGPALSRPKPEEGNEKEGWPARTDLVLRRAGWVHDRTPAEPSTVKQLRFLTLAQAADELNTEPFTLRALIGSGELPAIQFGGRGQRRIERVKGAEYIATSYARAAAAIKRGHID